MWSAACFQDLGIPWPVTTWGVLGLLHVMVPLAEWRRIAPFVLMGWGFGSWNLSSSESDMTFHDPTSPTLMCLDCRPTFTVSLGSSTQHGVFLCQNDLGQRGALWLSVPDTALRMAGRKWVRVTSPRPSDLSDAFDFPARLASLGVDRPFRSRSARLGNGVVVGLSAASRVSPAGVGQTCDGCVGVDWRLGDA